jgi:hypothetical protein
MLNENQKATARLLLFERKAQEIYTEMRSRGLCEVGDEIKISGGPMNDWGHQNSVRTWATQESPDRVIMLLTDKQQGHNDTMV